MGWVRDYDSRRTLASGIDYFHKTHFIVHYEFLLIRVLYCWIIGLGVGESYRTRGEMSGGGGTDL